MKKTFITLTCASILILSGCEKKTPAEQDHKNTEAQTSSVTSQATLSTNNKNDITQDFESIQKFSELKEKEAAELSEKVENSLASSDESEKAKVALEMSNKRAEINKEYASLPLKSSEVSAFREKSMKINNLAIELTTESTSKSPNAAKITEIMKSIQDAQADIEKDVKSIQAKISS